MEHGIETALERWEACKTGWNEIYEAARRDQKFYAGNQWEDDAIKSRDGKPSLVTSHLQQFVHHTANQLRANTPQMRVAPVDDVSDVATAKVIQGMLRGIESVSNADIAYDDASENQIISSFGFIRIDHDYIAPDKFEQHVLIKPVVNPLSVMIDPASIMPDGSDAKYGFVLDEISVEDFEKLYPEFAPMSFGEKTPAEDRVVVAEYFCLVPEKVEIGLLEDGRALEMAKIEELNAGPVAQPLNVVKTRVIERNKVIRQKLSGSDVLEETTFPGCYIPLIPVYGEIRWVDGKREIWSLIRNAKDSQRMINYYNSLIIESLSKAPQAPFVGIVGQFETDPDSWKNPHRAMVLQYDHVDLNGAPAPAPQRLAPPPMPAGAYEAKMASIEEMKAAMGLNASNMGVQDNASSGLAISHRQRQGDVAVAHFGDNRNRSVAHVGRVILSMLPEIYDTPRIVRILNDEDEAMHVAIGAGSVFDVNAGKYDVTIEAGPSFSSRREEVYQLMLNLLQTNPQLMNVIGDLVFKYSDVPGADIISERLKRTIPPQLLGGAENDPEKQQMQQVLQQLQQQLQAAQAELQSKHGDLQLKAGELQLKAKEVELKQGELQIKAMQAQAAVQQGAPEQQGDNIDPMLVHKATMEERKMQHECSIKERELALKESEFNLKVQQMQLDVAAAMQAAQANQKAKEDIDGEEMPDAEDQLEAQKADAIIQTLAVIAQQLNGLTTAVNQPKQVVRDPATGLIMGVK